MCQDVRFGVYSMPLVECANNILALLLSEDRLNYKQQLRFARRHDRQS